MFAIPRSGAAAAVDRGGDNAVRVRSSWCKDRNFLLSQARVEASNPAAGLRVAKKGIGQATLSGSKEAVKAQVADWEAFYSKRLRIQPGGIA